MRSQSRDFSDDITLPERHDFGIPGRKRFLKLQQILLHVGVLLQGLLQPAGARQRVRLLKRAVDEDVLIIGLRLRQRV